MGFSIEPGELDEGGGVVMHPAWHAVADRLRGAGTQEALIAALLGHAYPTMTARYGRGWDVKSLAAAIRTIHYREDLGVRDDFPVDLKRTVAARVAHVCSNPGCHAVTAGPHEDPARVSNIGVAAHITAASAGGPRYNAKLTQAERQSAKNAIWLCQNCAKLIDSDPGRFTVEVLERWKEEAEAHAREQQGKTGSSGRSTGKVSVQLPAPVNPVGGMSAGNFTPQWSAKLRLIQEGSGPVGIVELGVSEESVGEWRIDELFREGSGKKVDRPIRLDPAEEFLFRATSPVTLSAKPARVGRLTVWCIDHKGERHESVAEEREVV